jgi:hypothetical protein
MFEWLFDQRKIRALEAFSVGPTQDYLRWAKAVTEADSWLFPTLDDLWTFYTATDTGTMWDTSAFKRLTWAPKITTVSGVCGADNPSSCMEAWLEAHQTSTTLDWSSSRWRNYATNVLVARDLILGTLIPEAKSMLQGSGQQA